MADVLPEVPFGGAEQTQPGFIQGMIQSLASPFNPAPNPIPAPTGAAPVAGPSVTTPPPQGGSQGGGVMDVLGKVGQFATNFLIGMGDDTGKYRDMLRMQAGMKTGLQMAVTVDQALEAGDIGTAQKAVQMAQSSGKLMPVHIPLIQKTMEKIAKVKDGQDFSQSVIPAMKLSGAMDRPEIAAFMQAAAQKGLDPKQQMEVLTKIFKVTPHFENGMMLFTDELAGPANITPQALPSAPKPGDFDKYSKAILAGGYASTADFVNKLSMHDPQALADAVRLPQAQNAIEQAEEVAITQKKSAIEEAKQKRVQAAGIGLQAAKEKEVFMFKQLQELPPQETRLYAKSVGINPNIPVGKYTPEDAQKIIEAKKSDDIAKQAMQGYEAARAGVEAKPIPETTANRILLNRQVLRGLKTVEANLEDKFVGKGFQGEAGAIWGQIRDTTGKSSESEIFFRRSINDVGDMLLRARSGAQINEQEYKRLTGLLPQISDEPTTFRAALKRVMTEVESDIRDRAKLAKQPAGKLEETDLSDVGPIYKMQPAPVLSPGGRRMGK